MPPRKSRGLWLVVAAVSSAAAGCSSDAHPTAPHSANTAAALAVATDFTRMGDSVVAAHGDTSAAIRFYGAAAVLKRIGTFDTITVDIDSVPQKFDAVALAVSDSGGPSVCPMPPMDEDGDAGYECPWNIPRMTRTLFAWQPGDPPHIVELVALADSSAIGLPGRRGESGGTSDSTMKGDSTAMALIPPARLKYFAGDGTGIWWGVAGTQQSTLTASTTACKTPSDSTSTSGSSADRNGGGDRDGHGWNGLYISSLTCHLATFNFSLSGTVGVPPVRWWAVNNASGTHEITVAAATVPGALVLLTVAAATGH